MTGFPLIKPIKPRATTEKTEDDKNENSNKDKEKEFTAKRNRLTLVCQACKRRKVKCDRVKPSCSTCLKTGVECIYKPLSHAPYQLQAEFLHGPATKQTSYSPRPSGRTLEDLQQLSKNELIDEYTTLKERIDAIENEQRRNLSAVTTPSSINDNNGGIGNGVPVVPQEPDIIINFYKHYSPLSFKSSSHEDYKPLNSMALHKKDNYYLFYISYLVLTLRTHQDSLPEQFKESWVSKHADGISKWLLLLDTQGEDRDLREPIKKIVGNRSQLFRNSSPFLIISNTDKAAFESLKPEIIKLLPRQKYFFTLYLEYFWKYIWILRPALDKTSFEANINRIITYDKFDNITISLTQRHDIAIISILLIILRYSTISLQLMDQVDISPEFYQLLSNPISIKAISTAQTCLSFYKIMSKTTLEILQALLYLRYYYRDSPEAGDGVTLLQSENLMGIIIHSAINMGLNREINPEYSQNFKVSELNLRRRIWYCIVELHSRSIVLAGILPTLPPSDCINVNCPIVLSFDTTERSLRDEILKEYELSGIYMEMSKVINDSKHFTSLRKLKELLEKSRSFIENNYSLSRLKPLSDDVTEKGYQADAFINVKIFTRNITQLSLESQIYTLICNHFESNEHLAIHHYKENFTRLTESTIKLIELVCDFLLGHYKDILIPYFNYEINPLMNRSIGKIGEFMICQMLRLYHALDLEKSNVNDLFLDQLSASFRKLYGGVLVLSKGLAKEYHTSLKTFAPENFGLKTLVSLKDKLMKRVMMVLSNGGKINGSASRLITADTLNELEEKYRKEESFLRFFNEWVLIQNNPQQTVKGKSIDSFININISNMYILLDEKYLHENYKLMNRCFAKPNLANFFNKDFYLAKSTNTNTKNNISIQSSYIPSPGNTLQSTSSSTTSSINGLNVSDYNKEIEYDFAFFDEIISSMNEFNQ